MTEVILKYHPREYQQDWIEDIWDSWSSGKRRVLAQLATGGGKTICFAQISNSFFKKEQQVLVVAHRIELITQAAEKLESIIGEPVGIIKGGIPPSPERKIQVASIQTLARREPKQLPANIGLLIFDEAHHVRIQVIETLAWRAFHIRTSRLNRLIFSTSNGKWPFHRFLLKMRKSWIFLEIFTVEAFQSFSPDLNPYDANTVSKRKPTSNARVIFRGKGASITNT